ncbi:hypothetical protein Tco_1379950 [Tanacetum coccineum]
MLILGRLSTSLLFSPNLGSPMSSDDVVTYAHNDLSDKYDHVARINILVMMYDEELRTMGLGLVSDLFDDEEGMVVICLFFIKIYDSKWVLWVVLLKNVPKNFYLVLVCKPHSPARYEVKVPETRKGLDNSTNQHSYALLLYIVLDSFWALGFSW